MNYLIVENQQDARELLEKYVRNDFPQMKYLGYAEHAVQAVELIRKLKPDLLFLDVNLGGSTAFEVLDALKLGINGTTPLILFVSAYYDSDTMLKAFEYFPLRYITKPIDRKKLQLSIDQAIHQFNLNPEHQARKIPVRPMQMDKLRIPKVKGEIALIKLDEILFLQSANEGQTTKIYCLPDQASVNSTKNLGYFKEILREHQNFFPISQSQIVNLNYLKSYLHHNKELHLHQYDEPLFASRRGGEDLRRWLYGE